MTQIKNGISFANDSSWRQTFSGPIARVRKRSPIPHATVEATFDNAARAQAGHSPPYAFAAANGSRVRCLSERCAHLRGPLRVRDQNDMPKNVGFVGQAEVTDRIKARRVAFELVATACRSLSDGRRLTLNVSSRGSSQGERGVREQLTNCN